MSLAKAHVHLDSNRLRLRPLQLEDAVAMHAIYADEQTMAYWSSLPSLTLADSRASVQADMDWVKAGQAMVWAVEDRAQAAVIGKCVLFNYHEQNRRAEIGYVLNRAYWGRGLMSEACCALLELCFTGLDLHRVEADADEHNAGSIALLEKLGFRREGFFPERWYVGGKWQNSVMFGLLKQHWTHPGPRLP